MRGAFPLPSRAVIAVALAAAFWLGSTPFDHHRAAAQDWRRVELPFSRCMNVAGALEAPREGDWGYVIRDFDIGTIAAAGFDSIRLPIKWSSHAQGKAPYKIDPKFLARIDHLINLAIANKMSVIIDMHHYDELNENPDKHEPRFEAMWAQLAEHYKDYPDNQLIFELINEPNDKFSGARMSDAQNRVLKMVRKTNPTRLVILSGDRWGNFEGLKSLAIPDDPNIVVSVHYYEPFSFTHQGARWLPEVPPMGKDWGREREIQRLVKYAQTLANWRETHKAPLFLGEFGAIEKAPDTERAVWTAGVRAALESVSIPWCHFDFANGFSAYDRSREAWRPLMLNALLPKGGLTENGS